jgi:hypothetical protein
MDVAIVSGRSHFPLLFIGRALLEYVGCCRRGNLCTVKLWMESVIVDKLLNADNAADLLLFADAHHCALLKETAMKICQNNADAVMRTEGWARLKESSTLLAELFAAVATTNKRAAADDDDDPERLGVAELRNRLLRKRGRIVDDVDGSREMLVKRLKSE